MAVSAYDKQHLSQAQQNQIAHVTQQAQSGKMSWADAHAAAEKVRGEAAGGGYSGGRYGNEHISRPSSNRGSSSGGGRSPGSSGGSKPASKGPGYVTGGHSTAADGSIWLDKDPNYNPKFPGTNNNAPDMRRRPDLAGKTANHNGYTIYYDENGYAKKASKGETGYRPHQDPNVGKPGFNGKLWTDQEMLRGDDVAAMDRIKADLAAGRLNGDQANQAANDIRKRYGYTIDKQGMVTDLHASGSTAARREHQGLGPGPTADEYAVLGQIYPNGMNRPGVPKDYLDNYTPPAAPPRVPMPDGYGGTTTVPGYDGGIPGMPSGGGSFPGAGGGFGSIVGGNSSITIPGLNMSPYQPGSLSNYLDEWFAAAKAQQEGKIDDAVQQGVNELTRAEQDAQAGFQTQRNQIALEEAQAHDRQAMYNEAQGNRGGIGSAQMDAISVAAAQNRLAVNTAQQKLATDTARQIQDLRNKGEFEKADALLELSQTYLSQLMSLEQWSMEFGLNVAQFNAQLQQWAADYEMQLSEITGEFRGKPTFAAQQGEQNRLTESGWQFLSAGVMPSPEQLKAMGMTKDQANSVLTTQKLEAARKASGGGRSSGGGSKTSKPEYNPDALYAYVKEHAREGGEESMLKNLAKQYGITSTAGLVEDYEAWLEGNKTFEEVDESELANKRTSFGIWIEDAKTGKGTAIPYSNLEPFYRDGKIDTRYNGDGTYTIIWLK